VTNVPPEPELRDYIAGHLEVVQPGLTLVSKEHYLPNPLGSHGFVDILARDQSGLHVVIELKRSNQAARQAIHELYKYTALLKTQNGLGASHIRCLLISTDWRELLVPFAEFVRSVDYQVTGLQLHLSATGTPTGTSAVSLPEAPGDAAICPHYKIWLFQDDGIRDSSIELLTAELDQDGVTDALLVALTYVGTDTRVVYPYGLMVAIGRLQEHQPLNLPRKAPFVELDADVVQPEDSEEHRESEWLYEQKLLSLMGGACQAL
jgi:hypothetical protein